MKEKWAKIKRVIEETRGSDMERILIVSLEDWNPSILSEKRKKLILMLRKGDVKSETDLARRLGRKRPNVVSDLNLLEHYGLIERTKQGQRVIPRVVKSQIVIY